MLNIHRILLFGLLTLANISICKAENEEFLISFVDHSGLINYYVPILNKAYQKIGISPTFIMINDQRALRLLNNAQIDADTAKVIDNLEHYPNITYLPTPISKVEMILICQAEISCTPAIFNQANKSLAVIGADEFYQEQLSNASIKLVELTSFEILYKMFDQQKVDVAIIVLDTYSKARLNRYPNHYKLFEKLGFHLLHKKHQALIPKLESAIAQVIAETSGTMLLDNQKN
ncbi:hypothetical protein [Thalassotalea sp. G2M2-11]|uniref:hypothetical protein n=1 Tax=Thalassotalea sp. G2M2-11 TaxID=2787627 RepID=UPI0019D00A01|nr:hypothetical protein [Thalassotalea sp. G2M2-11]